MRMSRKQHPHVPQWNEGPTLDERGNPVLAALFLRACTWCDGDMYLDSDHWGAYLKCLQCGRECDAPDHWLDMLDEPGQPPTVAARRPQDEADVS